MDGPAIFFAGCAPDPVLRPGAFVFLAPVQDPEGRQCDRADLKVGPDLNSDLFHQYRLARIADFPTGDRCARRCTAVPGDGETIAVVQDVEHGCFLKGTTLSSGAPVFMSQIILLSLLRQSANRHGLSQIDDSGTGMRDRLSQCRICGRIHGKNTAKGAQPRRLR
jgi:hypothetical protein